MANMPPPLESHPITETRLNQIQDSHAASAVFAPSGNGVNEGDEEEDNCKPGQQQLEPASSVAHSTHKASLSYLNKPSASTLILLQMLPPPTLYFHLK